MQLLERENSNFSLLETRVGKIFQKCMEFIFFHISLSLSLVQQKPSLHLRNRNRRTGSNRSSSARFEQGLNASDDEESHQLSDVAKISQSFSAAKKCSKVQQVTASNSATNRDIKRNCSTSSDRGVYVCVCRWLGSVFFNLEKKVEKNLAAPVKQGVSCTGTYVRTRTSQISQEYESNTLSPQGI